MSGQCCLHRHVRGLLIADLANHHDIGILAQHRAKRVREVEPDFGLDLHLIEIFAHHFDRVFDGRDVDFWRT